MKLNRVLPLLFVVTPALATDVYVYQQFETQKHSGVWGEEKIHEKFISERSNQRAINLSGGVEDISYDIKLYQAKDSIEKVSRGHKEIKSLYMERDIDDKSSIRFGRYQENWQVGNAFAPLSLTDPYSRGTTLTNPYRAGRGINGITYNYFTDDSEFNLYWGVDHRDKNSVRGYGYKTIAGRYSTALNDDTDISVVVHKYNVGSTGIGGSFRNIYNDSTSIYGSTMIRKGTASAIHKGVLDNTPNKTFTTNPIDEHRINDGKIYHNSMVGMQYTTEKNYNFMVEYSYNSAGMNKTQWDTYKTMVDYHRKLPNQIAKYGNLLWDSSLIGNGGLRQHYLFVRAQTDINDITPSIGARVSADKSALWIAEIEYKGIENILIGGKFTTTTGGKGTEYGSYFPTKNKMEIYLARTF